MATTNSIVNYHGNLQERERKGGLARQGSLFEKDDDELSIDLNDGGALFGTEQARPCFEHNIPPCVVSLKSNSAKLNCSIDCA